ncbi:glycosyltransferase [Scytonema sp. NUACC26]|uniref:glycosyltransferase n=1 Tax=Scytonema sp. NUACC26 TaxID=3140176 RepID=UPI0034DC0FEB
MSHQVLIVSPHFPPINAADHQRVRMSLPYFKDFGWEAHVLTVRPDCVEGVQDFLLAKTVPSHIPVTYTRALSIQVTRRIGMSTLGLRCFPYLLKAGDRLLHQNKFDLIYFSTTVFITMALGFMWYKRFGIPYVLDFQDPWLNDYYKQPGAAPPPGGRWKYGYSQLQAKLLEPKTLSKASHVISVSPAYPQMLQQRYPQLRPDQFTVLPFGAPEADFEQVPFLNIQQTIFDPNDGKRHWVYVGAVGKIMEFSLRALFLGIESERRKNPELWQTVRLHFVGTSYAPKDRAVKTVEPIAQELGVADLVTEHTQRIPYFEALKVLTDSDAILLIGSNDPGYTASKLYPCILACKPILAIFHKQSSVVDILHQCQAGQAIAFSPEMQPSDLLSEVTFQLRELLSLPKGYQPKTNWEAFQPYTAREMTRQQCAIFDKCLSPKIHSQSL